MTPLQTIPPWGIAIILCLLIATFTECTSNVATATLFLPVLASMVSSQRESEMCLMKKSKDRIADWRRPTIMFGSCGSVR